MVAVTGVALTAISSGVLTLVNLVGNCTICAVILRNTFMQTPVNFLLFNLAVADITVGVFTLPVHVFGALCDHPDGSLGMWLCKLVTGDHNIYIGATVSALSLSAIAYERYQAVVHPFTAREKVTKKKTFIFIVLAWTVAVSISMFFKVLHYFNKAANKCTVFSGNEQAVAMYAICYGILVFGVPFVIMILLYGRVIWELVKKTNHIVNRDQLAVNRAKKKVTAMLVTVTVIFAATWGAAAILLFVDGRYSPESPASITYTFLICINSSLNCFLYALFSSQFRRGLKNLLSSRGCKNQNYQERVANSARENT